MNSFRGRPSPAIIVAVCALAFAMVGTAVAGTDGLSQKITKSKVKKIAKKQANKQINKRESGLSVAKAVNADNATNATNAGNATTVGGLSVKKFASKQPVGTGLTSVAILGTLDLRAGCQADGDPVVEIAPAPGAASQADRTAITLTGANSTEGNGNSSLGAGGLTVVDGTEDNVDGQIEAVTSGGAVTTIQFAARESGNFSPSESVCLVWGTSIAG